MYTFGTTNFMKKFINVYDLTNKVSCIIWGILFNDKMEIIWKI